MCWVLSGSTPLQANRLRSSALTVISLASPNLVDTVPVFFKKKLYFGEFLFLDFFSTTATYRHRHTPLKSVLYTFPRTRSAFLPCQLLLLYCFSLYVPPMKPLPFLLGGLSFTLCRKKPLTIRTTIALLRTFCRSYAWLCIAAVLVLISAELCFMVKLDLFSHVTATLIYHLINLLKESSDKLWQECCSVNMCRMEEKLNEWMNAEISGVNPWIIGILLCCFQLRK